MEAGRVQGAGSYGSKWETSRINGKIGNFLRSESCNKSSSARIKCGKR